MEFPTYPSSTPFPLLLSLSRHNFDFLDIAYPFAGTVDSSLRGAAVSSTFFIGSVLSPPAGRILSYHFVLDPLSRVEKIASLFQSLHDCPLEQFLQQPFSMLLGAESQPLWQAIVTGSGDGRDFSYPFLFSFVAPDGKLVPACCTLTTLLPTKKLLVDAFLFPDLGHRGASPVLSKTAVLMQRVHAYLIANLDATLPSIPALARFFGTNESQLKSGFRQAYGTGIYHFHRELRLELAHSMLHDVSVPFSEIATACGFGSYAHFSKAFSKRFGLSPREASRRRVLS